MSTTRTPTTSLLKTWLTEAGIDHEICDQCAGLHIRALQEIAGVIEGRLFLEEYGLLLSTSFEIRPTAVLPVVADLGRLNMDYPPLKIFLDVVDDSAPHLVVGGIWLTGAGISQPQFDHFLSLVIESVHQFGQECLQLDYLFAPEDPDNTDLPRSLH